MKAGSSNPPNPEIMEWLKGSRNYTRGLALLLQYANKPATLLRLTKHRNQQQLERALRMALHPPAQPKPRLHERKVIIPIVNEPLVNEAANAGVVKETTRQDSEQLEKKRAQWKAALKQLEVLRHQLYFIGRDPATHATEPLTEKQQQQRAAIAMQVMQLDGECSQLVAEMKYYDRTGLWPKKEPAARKKKAANANEKENARKNLTKIKRRIEVLKEQLAKANKEADVVRINRLLNKKQEALTATQNMLKNGK